MSDNREGNNHRPKGAQLQCDMRHWSDRHGPLAFAIVGCVTAMSLLGIAVRPDAVAVIVPAVTASLAGMHYGREWARQRRDKEASPLPLGGQHTTIPHGGNVS